MIHSQWTLSQAATSIHVLWVCLTHLPSEMTLVQRLYVSAECITGLLSMVCNGLVLFAIMRYTSLHTSTSCFIASLAAADALVGVYLPPAVILTHMGLPYNFHECVAVNSIMVLVTTISILSLLNVTLDRFVAIRLPLLYDSQMSCKKALIIVAITWLIAITLGSIPEMGWHQDMKGFGNCSFNSVIDRRYIVYIIFFSIDLPLLLIMVAIYLYIFHTTRQHHLRTLEQLPCVLSKTSKLKAHLRNQDVRVAKGFASVVIVFAVCWLPLNIINTMYVLSSDYRVPEGELLAAVVLSHINSVINPFCYAFSNPKIKIAIGHILRCDGRGTDELTTIHSCYFRVETSHRSTQQCEETIVLAQKAQRGPNCIILHTMEPPLSVGKGELTGPVSKPWVSEDGSEVHDIHMNADSSSIITGNGGTHTEM